MQQEFEEKMADALEAGLRGAKMTPEQVFMFRTAFEKTLGLKPLTLEEFRQLEKSTKNR